MEAKHYETYQRVDPRLLQSEYAEKTVLITGGGHGIGTAIARSFVESSVARVILVGRTMSKLQATADDLKGSNATTEVSAYVVDISSKDDVEKLFTQLNATNVSVDVLINNAGYLSDPSNFIDADLDEYWKSFSTNVYGTALMTQSFLRHRKARQQQGLDPAIVITLNTIGAYSLRVPQLSAYGASKAALARWSELLAEDIDQDVARFVSVHPGMVKTDMAIKSGLHGLLQDNDAQLVGDFLVWAASKEAEFLSGRFVWVNWDVDELVRRRDEILQADLLRTALSG